MTPRKRRQTPPFSLRLTETERAALERAAGYMPLGAYIRSRLFEAMEEPRRRHRRPKVEDQQALARVLAELGRSRIASNLNQLAKAVNTGSLPVNPDTEAAIQVAKTGIELMRADLLRALGLNEGASHDP
jgi:hypothetical protein